MTSDLLEFRIIAVVENVFKNFDSSGEFYDYEELLSKGSLAFHNNYIAELRILIILNKQNYNILFIYLSPTNNIESHRIEG
jgi:hypothetical protein